MAGNIEISTSNDHNLCHVITTCDLVKNVKNNEYMRILKKISHTSIINCAEGNILKWTNNIDSPNDIENILKLCKKFNFEYVFFWFEGNTINGDFEDEFLEWAKMRSKDWTMMGHILDRPHRCPTLHNQVVVFNMSKFRDTKIDLSVFNEDFSDFQSSEKHIHDDYTPLWLKSKAGTTDRPKKPQHVFDEVMWILLSQEHTVVNVPEEIREQKHCVYPEEDEEQTVKWLLDDNLKNYSLEQAHQLAGDVGWDKSILTDHMLAKDVVYVTNTDDHADKFNLKNIDTIICPASGFNQFMYAFKTIDTLEKMIWVDFSKSALWWTKYVIDNFEGKNFESFWHSNKQKLKDNMNEHKLIECNVNKMKKIDNFLKNHDKTLWEKVKKIDHVFLNIDIVNEYELILEHVSDSNLLIQMTNIFSYDANYLNNKYHTAYNSFYDMCHKLVETNKNVYFHGDTPNGNRHRVFTNISRTAF